MLGRVLAGLVVLVLAAGAAALWLYQQYESALARPLVVSEAGDTLLVEPGATLPRVARELASRGLVEEPRYLVWYGRWHGLASRIKAGEYALAPGITPVSLIEDLVAGRVVHHSLTLVEGWNFRQVREAVAGHPRLEHTLAGLDDAAVMEAIGKPGEHPEGRFFPDTYLFPSGTTDREFLRRAYDVMAERLAQAWAGRAGELPYERPYEALIMASIVEKETGDPAERARIAGVFVRRLEKGMRLETDPTVIYGLGESFDGNLTRRHLRGDTPYNTYVHRGLPPTPIAMPGAAALEAALHPAEGEELFFVARGDGSHHFSATLTEHNRAVNRYQRGGRRGTSTADAGAEAQ